MNLHYDHAHFRCADLEQAIDFYQKLLDAEIVKRSEHGGRIIVTLRIGGAHICLSPAPPGSDFAPEEKAKRLGVYHLAFLVPNLDAAIAACKRRGANFVIENLMANPKRKVAFFEAPDGMQVELMEDLS
ncbi:VOC family protein [candidate division KSB1 bacterium]|nr:VOC family protein [candidate division KSB1 bacterium]